MRRSLTLLAVVSLINPYVSWASPYFKDWPDILSLVKNVDKSAKIAVSWIYDGDTYAITKYSGYLRDQIEVAILKEGFSILPRKDIIILMSEIDSFQEEEVNIYKLKADVVICGVYYLDRYQKCVTVILKSINMHSNTIIGTVRFKLDASKEDLKRMEEVVFNIKSEVNLPSPIKENNDFFNPLPSPVKVGE